MSSENFVLLSNESYSLRQESHTGDLKNVGEREPEELAKDT